LAASTARFVNVAISRFPEANRKQTEAIRSNANNATVNKNQE
jgi:hypothetical protein